MSKILAALVAIAALLLATFDASAARKRCMPGFKYDKVTKMCVPVRGSF